MPEFRNVWTTDGKTRQCTGCGELAYGYDELANHRCRGDEVAAASHQAGTAESDDEEFCGCNPDQDR